jgi:hypothetical protein
VRTDIGLLLRLWKIESTWIPATRFRYEVVWVKRAFGFETSLRS